MSKKKSEKITKEKAPAKKLANKKLKVGEFVFVRFLGEGQVARVSEVVSKGVYKVELRRGTILPNIKWLNEKDKVKPVWYIESIYENPEENEV